MLKPVIICDHHLSSAILAQLLAANVNDVAIVIVEAKPAEAMEQVFQVRDFDCSWALKAEQPPAEPTEDAPTTLLPPPLPVRHRTFGGLASHKLKERDYG